MQSLKQFFARYNNDLPKPLRKGKYLMITLLITWPITMWLLFFFGINIESIKLGFQKQIGFDYVWSLDNFKNLFNATRADSASLLIALKNTGLFFVLDTIIMVPLTFYISYCFYRKIKGHKFFKVIIFLPTILPGMLTVTVFKRVFGYHGIVNNVVDAMGMSRMPDFLGNEQTAIWMVLFYCFWAGLYANVLIFQGGMCRVPKETLEAARLDGCSYNKELWHIMLPMMYDTLTMVLLLKLSGIFMVSGPILLLTGGYHNTQTINFWIYRQTMDNNLTFPSAAGLVFTLISIPIIIIAKKLITRFDPCVEY